MVLRSETTMVGGTLVSSSIYNRTLVSPSCSQRASERENRLSFFSVLDVLGPIHSFTDLHRTPRFVPRFIHPRGEWMTDYGKKSTNQKIVNVARRLFAFFASFILVERRECLAWSARAVGTFEEHLVPLVYWMFSGGCGVNSLRISRSFNARVTLTWI